MSKLRYLLSSLGRLHRGAARGPSRRDVLMVSLGGALPMFPAAAQRQLPDGLGGTALPAGGISVARADAPPRSIQAKSLDIYSVNDKGADGDGKTDNTAAINTAILEVHSGGGGEIMFGASPLPYRVVGPVLVPSNVVLNLNGQTLTGDGFNGGTMFMTGMVSDGRLVRNKGASDESGYVFYSSIRNGTIRKCAIAFDFQNFNVSCSIDDVATFEVLQFGLFRDCFYMSMRNCSARGPSDRAKPAFAFTGNNNLISLLRVSATMESGFLFAGGTTSLSMIACSCEGSGGSAVTFRDDCLGVVIDSGYWEAIQGTVFDFTGAKVCSVSFRGNFLNYCDTIIDDGGEGSAATLMGLFDDTNYLAGVDGTYERFRYRGRMVVSSPRNFMRFDIPFANDAPAGLPANWLTGGAARISQETAFTGRSLADVRSRSRLYHRGPIPLTREGDMGDPFPGQVDRCRITLPKGQAVTAMLDTGIVWRPNSLRATYVLSVADDGGAHKLFGDIYGDSLIRQDDTDRRLLLEDREGHVRLRLDGIDNRSGRASITGSVQLCA